MAQVLVQNRVAMAQPDLPELVNRNGVSVKKKSPNVLMIVNLFSRDGSRDNLYLSNYATIQLRDELARLEGVGDISYLGQRDYSMRLWLDPEKMSSRGITADDVVAAVSQQNLQVAAGQIGEPPVPAGQIFQYTMTTLGRLVDADQFADMILKTDDAGRLVRMRDVARIELGAQGYDQTCTLDGQPSVALSIYQLPGSNALKTATLVRNKMEELKGRFPEGLDYDIVYDTTPFITESINEVFKTLRDAVILVALVVLLFLQNWRSAIIPLIAVPVAVIGTFAVMAAMGFSLNNLTLFGLVLAIGIVVDDAIVVVEAVQYHIEHGLAPREASIKAMSQVSGPVIAVGLVLGAVFIPCAFITGITGQFFRQFALTIAVSTLISAFNSLTLSPALSAVLLRPHQPGRREDVLPMLAYVAIGGWAGYAWLTPLLASALERLPAAVLPAASVWWVSAVLAVLLGQAIGWPLTRPLNWILGRAFGAFNTGFQYSTNVYARLVAMALRTSVVVLVLYGGLLGLTYLGFTRAPAGFIPMQDKGYLLVNVQLPDAASVERTERVMHRIEAIARDPKRHPGVRHTVAVAGQSLLLGANAPNFGAMYVMLDDFHKRTAAGLSGDAIAASLQKDFQDEIHEGLVNVFGAPPVDGLGTAGGIKIIIEDRGDDNPLPALQLAGQEAVDQGRQTPGLEGLFCSFRADTPWLFLDIDRTQVRKMGVSMGDLFNTIQVYLASLYINDFNRFGRTWQVNVQGDAKYRKQVDDLKLMKVRNNVGTMVPLGTMATVRNITGPVMIQRYNMYPAAAVNAAPAPGVSSGAAIRLLRRGDRQGAPPGDAHRLDRAGAVADPDRQHRLVRLHPGRRPGLPRPGRTIRKLVAAAGGHPRGAHVPALLDRRRGAGPLGRQHLHPGRLRRAGGPGLQERHSHRRVRQGPARRGRGARRRHPGRLPPAAAAHRDDLLRLHLRRHPLDGLPWGRGGNAPHPGHRRLQRHVGRHPLRHLPHARLLLRHRLGHQPLVAGRNVPSPSGRELTAISKSPLPPGEG